MKDSVVVGLRCLLFCRKLVKRENIVTENFIKNHNMFWKNEFRQFIYEFRLCRKFCDKYAILDTKVVQKSPVQLIFRRNRYEKKNTINDDVADSLC